MFNKHSGFSSKIAAREETYKQKQIGLISILSIFMLVIILANQQTAKAVEGDFPYESCVYSMTNSDTLNTIKISAGFSREIDGTSITVSCPANKKWQIEAVGNTNNELGNNSLVSDLDIIPSMEDETAESQSSSSSTNEELADLEQNQESSWGMKVLSLDTENFVADGFSTFHSVPQEQTIIALDAEGQHAPSSQTFKIKYKVNVAATQASGIYTGAVRFILTQPIDDEPAVNMCEDGEKTLQSFTTQDANNMLANSDMTVCDARDGKHYDVGKMDDGNVWMLEDLAYLPENTTLHTNEENVTDLTTSTDSNFVYGDTRYEDNGYYYNNYAVSNETLCPTGWTVPSTARANYLFQNYTTEESFVARSSYFDTAIYDLDNDVIEQVATKIQSDAYDHGFLDTTSVTFSSRLNNSFIKYSGYFANNIGLIINIPNFRIFSVWNSDVFSQQRVGSFYRILDEVSQFVTIGSNTNSMALPIRCVYPNSTEPKMTGIIYRLNSQDGHALITGDRQSIDSDIDIYTKYSLTNLTMQIQDAKITPTGYHLKSWNTAADGSGTSYSPNDILTINNNQILNLYSIWEEDE